MVCGVGGVFVVCGVGGANFNREIICEFLWRIPWRIIWEFFSEIINDGYNIQIKLTFPLLVHDPKKTQKKILLL